MNNKTSRVRKMVLLVATAGFAAGAWAQEVDESIALDDQVLEISDGDAAGEEIVGGGEEIYETGVVDDGFVADGEVNPEEAILYMTGFEGEGEAMASGEPVVDADGTVTGFVDADGNLVYFRADDAPAMEMEEGMMYALASQSGAAASVMSVTDTASEQGGIDGGAAMPIEIVGAGGFAGAVDVTTAPAAGVHHGSASGMATRISAGHLSVPGQ